MAGQLVNSTAVMLVALMVDKLAYQTANWKVALKEIQMVAMSVEKLAA
jgi:hypothetical protein